jgi:hypothetical protein
MDNLAAVIENKYGRGKKGFNEEEYTRNEILKLVQEARKRLEGSSKALMPHESGWTGFVGFASDINGESLQADFGEYAKTLSPGLAGKVGNWTLDQVNFGFDGEYSHNMSAWSLRMKPGRPSSFGYEQEVEIARVAEGFEKWLKTKKGK